MHSKASRDKNSESIEDTMSDSISDSRCKTDLFEAEGINGKIDLINEVLPNVLYTEGEKNYLTQKLKK